MYEDCGSPAALHEFGGAWTELKLRAVADYLTFYTRALQAKPEPSNPFRTWYIDAFAGSGERTEEQIVGGLLDGTPTRRQLIQLDGSAKRALAIDPPFKHFVFIESVEQRYQALKRLQEQHPGRDIRCVQGDANAELRKLFAAPPWVRGSANSGLQRGVVFLDPYGMNVHWSTLAMLADTRRVDVWYLFPLHAALRQLAHKHGAVDKSKQEALTEVFGTCNWEDEFYRDAEERRDLLDMVTVHRQRDANPDKVEAYARKRLQTIFSFVSEPIPILTKRRLREFSLFCATGNQSPQAIDLIRRGVEAQLKKYGRGASRHTSGH